MLAETNGIQRPQVSLGGPGPKLRNKASRTLAELANSPLANNQSLHRTSYTGAHPVQPGPCHNRRPKSERDSHSFRADPFRVASAFVTLCDLATQVQEQSRNIDLDRANFAAGSAQAGRIG